MHILIDSNFIILLVNEESRQPLYKPDINGIKETIGLFAMMKLFEKHNNVGVTKSREYTFWKHTVAMLFVFINNLIRLNN